MWCLSSIILKNIFVSKNLMSLVYYDLKSINLSVTFIQNMAKITQNMVIKNSKIKAK